LHAILGDATALGNDGHRLATGGGGGSSLHAAEAGAGSQHKHMHVHTHTHMHSTQHTAHNTQHTTHIHKQIHIHIHIDKLIHTRIHMHIHKHTQMHTPKLLKEGPSPSCTKAFLRSPGHFNIPPPVRSTHQGHQGLITGHGLHTFVLHHGHLAAGRHTRGTLHQHSCSGDNTPKSTQERERPTWRRTHHIKQCLARDSAERYS
jgi:hypothetical protein